VKLAMQRIICEGGKVFVYAILGSQGLPASLFPDSTARNALSAKFVGFVEPLQASMVGVSTQEHKEFIAPLETAAPGTVFFKCPRQHVKTLGSVPDIREEDIARLLQDLAVLDDFGNGEDEVDNSDPVVESHEPTYRTNVHEWVETMTSVRPGAVMEKWRAYRDYEVWVRATKGVSVGDQMFARLMKEHLEAFGLREGNPTGVRSDGTRGQVSAYVGRCHVVDSGDSRDSRDALVEPTPATRGFSTLIEPIQ
jgi:hypothetical protein